MGVLVGTLENMCKRYQRICFVGVAWIFFTPDRYHTTPIRSKLYLCYHETFNILPLTCIFFTLPVWVCVELGNVLRFVFNTLENCEKKKPSNILMIIYFFRKILLFWPPRPILLSTLKILLQIVEVEFSEIPKCKTKENLFSQGNFLFYFSSTLLVIACVADRQNVRDFVTCLAAT